MKPLSPLEKEHNRSAFECGKLELNEYLKKFARQTQDRGGAKTYVAVDAH
jgi:hypothetical protein